MTIIREIEQIRSLLAEKRRKGMTIGLVPTMGALHEGHGALLQHAVRENPVTVCTLFVNPVQFNNPADLSNYPVQEEKDIASLEQWGVTYAFIPSRDEMYPESATVSFDFGALSSVLEGAFRPGHFSGVALVVAKLFNIIQPDHAYFGQKDYQQFVVISQLAQQLSFDVALHCLPTVRDAHGLALSSRNQHLSAPDRETARQLYAILQWAADELKKGSPVAPVQQEAKSRCSRHHIKMEYLALAHPDTFALWESLGDNPKGILLIAGWAGPVRLIDNLLIAVEK